MVTEVKHPKITVINKSFTSNRQLITDSNKKNTNNLHINQKGKWCFDLGNQAFPGTKY